MTELLLDRANCFLAVIDVQDVFLDKLQAKDRAPLVARIAWLTRVAGVLGVPVLAMAEDIAANGPPVPEVLAALPGGAPVLDKHVFGLAGQADILAAALATGRRQAVLVGLETDVCVAQSALGLLTEGFAVGAVSDATGSPGAAHSAGLSRMAAAGVTLLTAKALYYEWLRDLESLGRVKALVGRYQPADLVL